MIELTFEAPNAPMSENEVRHWAAKARRLKPWREAVAAAWSDSQGWHVIKERRCRVEVALPFRVQRRRDPHNYVGTVCKALVDELVKQGAWPDDTPEWVTVPEPTLEIRDDNQVTVRLVPESIEESLEKLRKSDTQNAN